MSSAQDGETHSNIRQAVKRTLYSQMSSLVAAAILLQVAKFYNTSNRDGSAQLDK